MNERRLLAEASLFTVSRKYRSCDSLAAELRPLEHPQQRSGSATNREPRSFPVGIRPPERKQSEAGRRNLAQMIGPYSSESNLASVDGTLESAGQRSGKAVLHGV